MSSKDESQLQLVEDLRMQVMFQKLELSDFYQLERRIKSGEATYDGTALLAAAEQGHLTAANAMAHLVADAIARGEEVAAAAKETMVETEVHYITNSDGSVTEVTQVTEHTVKKTVNVRNLGKVAKPQDRKELTAVRELTAETKDGRMTQVSQLGMDSAGGSSLAQLSLKENAHGSRQTVEVAEADADGAVVSTSSTVEMGRKAINAPKGGANAPKGGANAPKGGANAPKGGAKAPKGGANAPKGGAKAPKGGAKASSKAAAKASSKAAAKASSKAAAKASSSKAAAKASSKAAAKASSSKAAAKAPEPEADWRASQDCKHGSGCRGRNGGCPFRHPERPDRSERPCKHGLGCRGRKSGKCHFDHPAEEEEKKVAAPPAMDLSGHPPEVRVAYARFTSDTAMMRIQGDVYAEATWALVNEAQFATLLAHDLVPPLSMLQPAEFCSGGAAAPKPADFRLEALDFFETPVTVRDQATVTFGKRQYRSVDHGAGRAGKHSNMCFYLATCAGDKKEAVAMKGALTPLADHIARTFGVPGTFAALGAPADIEVVLAHVWVSKVPMCIASLETGKAVFIRPRGESRGETVYLQLAREHYTRLVFP
jgi:hypothetical protein